MTPNQKTAITRHGEQLNAIFHTGLDPITLCKKLRRIEGAAHKLAEDCCNHLSMESEEYFIRSSRLYDRIAKTLFPRSLMGTKDTLHYTGIFINLDPRGYALKIDDEYMSKHNIQLYRDWGGYGCLAPEFDKNGN